MLLSLILISVFADEELYDFRTCFQEKIAINILTGNHEGHVEMEVIKKIYGFLEDFEQIRNNYDNLQPMRFTQFKQKNYEMHTLNELGDPVYYAITEIRKQSTFWTTVYGFGEKLFIDGKINAKIPLATNSTVPRMHELLMNEMISFEESAYYNFYIIILPFNLGSYYFPYNFEAKFTERANEEKIEVIFIK